MNGKFGVFVLARKLCSGCVVDLGERRLLRLQLMQEVLDLLRSAFCEDFDACVASVEHVTCQAVAHGYAVNEGAKTYALNYARNVNSNTQG